MSARENEFGDRLRGLIQASRYPSLRQFALEIEMEPTYLSRILNGHVSVPDPPTIRRIAKGLDLAPDQLRHLTGIAEPERADADARPLPAIEDVLDYMSRDPEIVAALDRLKRTKAPAVYARLCRQLAEAWRSNGRMMLATWETAMAARDDAEADAE